MGSVFPPKQDTGRKAEIGMAANLFGKTDRITNRKDYLQLAKHGKRIQTADFIIVYAASRHPRSRLGITVSKKVGNAVVRNRIKRLIREYFRLNRHHLAGAWDINCIAKPNVAKLQNRDIHQALETVFSQIPP